MHLRRRIVLPVSRLVLPERIVLAVNCDGMRILNEERELLSSYRHHHIAGWSYNASMVLLEILNESTQQMDEVEFPTTQVRELQGSLRKCLPVYIVMQSLHVSVSTVGVGYGEQVSPCCVQRPCCRLTTYRGAAYLRRVDHSELLFPVLITASRCITVHAPCLCVFQLHRSVCFPASPLSLRGTISYHRVPKFSPYV